MKYRLMEHQNYTLSMMEANPSLGLFLHMGLGKTAIALTYVYRHLKKGDFRDGVLVVCPASLIPSWEQAIDDMINFEEFDSRAVQLLKDSITIRSFQKMYKTTKVPVKRTGNQVITRRSIALREDIDKPWSCFIVDEAHQCSAHNAVQTKAAITIAKLSKHRYVLTGSPTHGGKGRPDFQKLFGLIQIITAGGAFKNWSEFSNKAVTAVDRWYKPLEYNDAYCKKLMADYSVVYRIEDCIDMPDKVEQDVPCPLAEKAMYNDLRIGDVMKYGLSIENAGGQYTKMLQICSGSMKVDDTNTLRLKTTKDDALADLLNSTDDPIVIFCNYRASIDHAEAVAKKAGRKVVVFDGRSKTETWKDFQNGKADCIICQYQSGGVGLNLQRAHQMILYEPCFSALLLAQAVARIYRKGQTSKCLYYYLYTPNTLERKVWTVVKSGVDLNEVLLERLSKGELEF